MAALLEDTRDWWAETLARQPDELGEDEKPATADSEGLRGFIEDELLPRLESRRQHAANRPVICDQAYGESLDPDRLERLDRYKVLDRKLEPKTSMLLKLKDLLQYKAANRSVSQNLWDGLCGCAPIGALAKLHEDAMWLCA